MGAAQPPDFQVAMRGLRVKRDEAQLTQFIAGVASTDREFASALARVLVDNAPAPRNFSPPIEGIFEMPGELVCRPEQRIWDLAASSKGYVDLLFRTADRRFVLLAELKLHSGYGREQVQRYLSGLGVYRNHGGPNSRAGLLAVTRNPPAYGEPERNHEGWLGSIRWAAIIGELSRLTHRDPDVTAMWREFLSVLERQGDFGMTDVDHDAVRAWAQAKRGRDQLVRLLGELAEPALQVVREALGRYEPGVPGEDLARLARRGKREKTLVFPHQGAVHLRVVIPSERRSERLRIQFTPGRESGPRFSVQARHPNAAQLPLPIQENLRHIAEELRLTWGFEEASELTDFRTHWSRSHALEEWLGDGGPTVVDRLLRLLREDVETLAATGIFDRRAGIAYRSEQTPEPAAERDVDEADEE